VSLHINLVNQHAPLDVYEQDVQACTFYPKFTINKGVPQGFVLGPLLFLLHIDNLHSVDKLSKLKLYADDVTLYREIKSESDCQLLQDLDRICDWAKKWQLCLNASKCEAFRISNKSKVIFFDYIVNSSPLFWKSSVKYSNLSCVSLFQPKLANH